MDCHLDVSTALINWKLLPSGINISADLTEFQRKSYNTLKDPARKYNNEHKGDGNKQIVKMVKVNPKIFTIKDRKRAGTSSAGAPLNQLNPQNQENVQ